MQKLFPRLPLLTIPTTVRLPRPRVSFSRGYWKVARVVVATATLLVLYAMFTDFRVR